MCQFLGNYRQKPRKCNKNSAEVPDDKLGRISLPASAWQGIDAVRLSVLTNILDRPVKTSILSFLTKSSSL
jgi:hypothetical protein